MKSEEMPTVAQPGPQPDQRCVICGRSATRLVDGEPGCDAHANLIYENQLEEYTRAHMT